MSSKFTWNIKYIKWVVGISVILVVIMTVSNISDKTQKYEIASSQAQDEEEISENFEKELLPESSSESETMPEALDEEKSIFVDIAGAVEKPSVVELDEGERLQKAVELAGGLSPDADRNAVNLAQKLIDGAQYIIPLKGEKLRINVPDGVGFSDEQNTGENNDGKININTATKEKLMELNGIGEVIAQRIIDYRNENGNFKSIDSIGEVSGIGAKKFDDIKNNICIN